MTEFTKNSNPTFGDVLTPAMQITEQDDANQYFEKYVQFEMSFNKTHEEAEKICRHNLGYYAAYYDNETMVRIQKLFKCCHPIFGNTIPTAEEAFTRGFNHK